MSDEPSKSDLKLKGIVDASTRYSGAYAEINTRITQRQNVIVIFLTLASALIGLGLAEAVSSHPGLWRAVYAMPLVVGIFSAMLRMHERQIAILRAFMAELEAHCAAAGIPNYHYGSQFARPALSARRRHDTLCAWLAVGALLIAFALSCYRWIKEDCGREEIALVVITMVCGWIGVLKILDIHGMRVAVFQSFNPVRIDPDRLG